MMNPYHYLMSKYKFMESTIRGFSFEIFQRLTLLRLSPEASTLLDLFPNFAVKTFAPYGVVNS